MHGVTVASYFNPGQHSEGGKGDVSGMECS